MSVQVESLALSGLLVVRPRVFGDERGFFLESWNERELNTAIGSEVSFVQDNHSHSVRDVLRGLHYQLGSAAQGKLVRVVSGAAFDVAVDIRSDSATYGRWVGLELSAENQLQLWVPPGFAHGFLVVSETADVLYKTTTYYDPASERSIAWNDPDLAIDWPLAGRDPLLSGKDRDAVPLAQAEVFG